MFVFKDRLQKVMRRLTAACRLTGSKSVSLMGDDDGFLRLSTEGRGVAVSIKIGRYHFFDDIPAHYVPYTLELTTLKKVVDSLSNTTYQLTFWAGEGFVLKSLEDNSFKTLSNERSPIETFKPKTRLEKVFGVDGTLYMADWSPLKPALKILTDALNSSNSPYDEEPILISELGKEMRLERRVLKFLIRTLCGDGNELLKISSNQTFGGFVFETDFGFLSVTESEPEPDGWQDTEFRMLKYKGVRYACLYGQETGALTVKDAASCHTAFSVFFYLPNAQELAELKDKARQDKSWIAYAVFLNNTSMYPSLDPYLDITKAVVDVIQKGYRFGFYNGELLAMQEGTAITVQKLAEQQKAYIKTWRLPEEREY